VVIGAVESDETDHKAADGLHPSLAIETEKPPASIFRFWRELGHSSERMQLGSL